VKPFNAASFERVCSRLIRLFPELGISPVQAQP
jgi:hypothetical protein